MHIGITGHRGFIGKHLVNSLKDRDLILFEGDITVSNEVNQFVDKCDIIVHLAGKNRGDEKELFYTNVYGFYNLRMANKKRIDILCATSSYNKEGPYKAANEIKSMLENICFYPLQMTNVIGTGCKPFYNSFVCTMCYLKAINKPYQHLIKDLNEKLILMKVEDVVNCITKWVKYDKDWSLIVNSFTFSVQEIVDILEGEEHPYSKMINEVVEGYKNEFNKK